MRSDCERCTFMLRKSMNRGSYADLPERFFARVDPMPVAKPQLLRFNHALGAELGLGYGGLEAEEPPANHCRPSRLRPIGSNGVQILDGPVNEHSRLASTRDEGHEWRGAGGQAA